MNVLDAISSGRRFRRKGEAEWRQGVDDETLLTYRSILANDWEVEPRAVTITDQEFYDAVAAEMKEHALIFMGPQGARTIAGQKDIELVSPLIRGIAQRLGISDGGK